MRLIYLIAVFFSTMTAFGARHAFVVQDIDSKQYIVQEGDVTERLSPYCTFNLVLSLIGFDTHILKDAQEPELPYKQEYKDAYLVWNEAFPEIWAAPHHPKNWMKHSCVWFSQALAQQFNMQSFVDYVAAFDYGNHNLLGDEGKENGLTRAWIGSSLRISPIEQVHFINRLAKQELPVSLRAQELTKEILFVEELSNGMKLYGKTGGGSHGKGQESDYRVGWFVGWVEKDNRRFSFAYLVHGSQPEDQLMGPTVKEQLKQRLLQLEY